MLLDFAVQRIAEHFDVSTAVYMVVDKHEAVHLNPRNYRTWTGAAEVQAALAARYTTEGCTTLALKLQCNCWVRLRDVYRGSPAEVDPAHDCTVNHYTHIQGELL